MSGSLGSDKENAVPASFRATGGQQAGKRKDRQTAQELRVGQFAPGKTLICTTACCDVHDDRSMGDGLFHDGIVTCMRLQPSSTGLIPVHMPCWQLVSSMHLSLSLNLAHRARS